MSTILNTLNREEILRIMKILGIIAGQTKHKAWSFEGIPYPSSDMSAVGIFYNLEKLYRALDPNNIDIHIRKDELDFTQVLHRD